MFIRTPPVIFNAPSPTDVAAVLLITDATPATDNVESTTAVPVTDKFCCTVTLLPTYNLPLIPAPPATRNAPVVELVEDVLSLNANDPAFIKVELNVLENVTLDPVDDKTTLPKYNELPLRYNSENGLSGDPRVALFDNGSKG